MLCHIKEYGKYVAITGYRNVTFERADAFLKASRKKAQQIQFFDANLIATWEHLYFATLNALRSFQSGTNVSKSLAMETMLYASGVRQIQKAIGRLGIKPQTTCMAVTVTGDDPKEVEGVLREVSLYVGSEPDETMLEMTAEKAEKIKAAFNISEPEIQTIEKNGDSNTALVGLVVERVALLATQL